MRNDQIFVLLLVVLLPLSGCFDNAVGEADAEERVDELPNEATPTVKRIVTIQVNPDETVALTLNGTALEFVSGWWCGESGDYCDKTTSVTLDINCDDESFPDKKYRFNAYGLVTPNQAGMECILEIDNPVSDNYEVTRLYSFVEHPLA